MGELGDSYDPLENKGPHCIHTFSSASQKCKIHTFCSPSQKSTLQYWAKLLPALLKCKTRFFSYPTQKCTLNFEVLLRNISVHRGAIGRGTVGQSRRFEAIKDFSQIPPEGQFVRLNLPKLKVLVKSRPAPARAIWTSSVGKVDIKDSFLLFLN